MNEFDLIDKYFKEIGPDITKCNGIRLGIGDDCALLDIPQGHTMAISTDTFLEGRHFFKNTDPYAIGYKALVVNLSDLAAMGARPLAFTLALSVPDVDETFIAKFARGIQDVAQKYGIPLVGGDTTSGPLSVTITVFGAVEFGRELRRDTAKIGDLVCVTGPLGGAALAVQKRSSSMKNGECSFTIDSLKGTPEYSLDYPTPRFDSSQALCACGCRCALDISDGIRGDLQHILDRSRVSAVIDWELIPKHQALMDCPNDVQHQLVLAGGDDYELCTVLSPKAYSDYTARAHTEGFPEIYKIGMIVEKGSNPQLDNSQVDNPDNKKNTESTVGIDNTGSTGNINNAENTENKVRSQLWLFENNLYTDITGAGYSHF